MMETEFPSTINHMGHDLNGDVDFSQPPPSIVHNLSIPPPNLINYNQKPNFQMSNQRNPRPNFRQPNHNNNMLNNLPDDFDGKRLRKTTMRKTVDYNSSIIKSLQNRVWQRDYRDRHALQPDPLFLPDVLPPPSYQENAINAVTTHFVKTATNKMRCPIFCMAWTPEGRRLVTGASSGEFTLWNGLTFNFETILQAHDSPVRSMVWSHNDAWMVTGDHAGYCKYWQSNMNNVKMFQAHKEPLRGLSFSPTDSKLVSCSDDGTLRIWDFYRCYEERVLRGHGADVKCCDWHPQLGLIVSGSKDNQQPIKLWDPKSGQALTTLHAHKATVMDLKWNKNGNWFITASRDHLLKLFDIRKLSDCVQTFRGHKKEASALAWHPYHEGLLASGGSDGAILFWHVGADKEVGAIDQAHESIVWTLSWHPLGHILCSGSNDHTSKFWTRNRPGDMMRDKYNLNILPSGISGVLEDVEIEEVGFLPGMAPEDRVELPSVDNEEFVTEIKQELAPGLIPGLEENINELDKYKLKSSGKKQPFAKPIPRNFVAQWNETGLTPEEEIAIVEGFNTESVLDPINILINKYMESQEGVVSVKELQPSAMIIFGKLLPVTRGSKLYRKIREGKDSLIRYVTSGKIPDLRDCLAVEDEARAEERFEEEVVVSDEDDEQLSDEEARKAALAADENQPVYDILNPKVDLRQYLPANMFMEPGEMEALKKQLEEEEERLRGEQSDQGDDDLRKPPSLFDFRPTDSFRRTLEMRGGKRDDDDWESRNGRRNQRSNERRDRRSRNYDSRRNYRDNDQRENVDEDIDERRPRDFNNDSGRTSAQQNRPRDIDERSQNSSDFDRYSNMGQNRTPTDGGNYNDNQYNNSNIQNWNNGQNYQDDRQRGGGRNSGANSGRRPGRVGGGGPRKRGRGRF